MTLGEYLLQARADRGYSIRELAERSRISTAEISRLESGKRLKPSPDVLRALADALCLEYSRLMQLAGYIEEVHEADSAFEKVFKDEVTGEIVDVVRGMKRMVEKDAAWANVAYRVSSELNDQDRRILTELAMTYLESKRKEKQDGGGV